MLLHPRTVKRWWRKLGVPPQIGGHGCHRWTEAQLKRLVKKWNEHWKKHGLTPQQAGDKFNGLDKFQAEQRQLKFPWAK